MMPGPPPARALLVVLLGATALMATVLSAEATPVEFSASNIYFNTDDMVDLWGEGSLCEQILVNIRKINPLQRKVQFIPTLYYNATELLPRTTYTPGVCNPDRWATAHLLKSYCSKYSWNQPCLPQDDAANSNFTLGLTSCFLKALALGFEELTIGPHLDNNGYTGLWRNMLYFDPLRPDENGNTYMQIMIAPILSAANAAFGSELGVGKTFHFGLQGEMGGTIFYAPSSWRKVVKFIRNNWTAASATLEVGIHLNHAFLPGVLNHGNSSITEAPVPVSKFYLMTGGNGPLLPFNTWPEHARLAAASAQFNRLFDDIDFLGMSNYVRTPVDVTWTDMEAKVYNYDAELAAMGVDFKAWLRKPGKKFTWDEFGVGGGISECGNVMAKTERDVGLFPWMGIFTSYNKSLDPFMNWLPASAPVPPVRRMAEKYYAAALEYLWKGGNVYPVTSGFMWSLGAWDALGVNPGTATADGTYAIPAIVDMVNQHNAKVAAAAAA